MTEPSAPVKVVFKAHAGYESPWITVEADSPESAVELLEQFEAAGGGARLGAVDESLKTQYRAAVTDTAGDTRTQAQANVQSRMPAQVIQRTAPAQQERPAPPGQNVPICEGHGVAMTYRTGSSAKGPWAGYFCNGTRDRNSKCPPQWVETK